jgi:LPXTG-motif cell wall-anchored protein
MPRKRRAAVLATAGAIGVIAAALAGSGAVLLVTPAAQAASPCAPAGFTATAGADLLKLSALDIAPLGARLNPLAGVTIGHGHTDIAHALPGRASAGAGYLTATLPGIRLPNKVLFSHASQTVPPAPATPDEHFVAKVWTPVLRLGVGHVKASAGRATGFTCGAASSFASVGDLALLPGGERSLFEMPGNLNGTTDLAVITENGHLAMRAVASAGLADFTILRGTAAAIGVKVVTEPTLTGIAGPTPSVTYTSPVLDVTLPDGAHVRLDGAHTSTDITSAALAPLAGSLLQNTALPLVGDALGAGKVHVHLAIGEFAKTVGAHAVTGTAATLHLTVSVEAPAQITNDAPKGAPTIGTPPGEPGGPLGGLLGNVLSGRLGGVLSGAGTTSAGRLPLASVPADRLSPASVPAGRLSPASVPASRLSPASVPAPRTSIVLDLGLGLLSVNAAAPGDGTTCAAGYGSGCGGGGGCYCSTPPTAPGDNPSVRTTPSNTTPSNDPHATPSPRRTVKATTSLPKTGGPTVWLVVLGSVLLGAGATIMRMTRRRGAL